MRVYVAESIYMRVYVAESIYMRVYVAESIYMRVYAVHLSCCAHGCSEGLLMAAVKGCSWLQ